MKNLIKIGFVNIGHWYLAQNKSCHIEYIIRPEYKEIKSTLYCFCVDNKPHYLGITESLKVRLSNYKSGKEKNKAGSTNKKVHSKILQALNQNKNVAIYILIPKEKIIYEGFEVCPYKGLENTLIKHYDFDEIWNERGKELMK
jgi:predicted GIY-YIG superfamily endonuclease